MRRIVILVSIIGLSLAVFLGSHPRADAPGGHPRRHPRGHGRGDHVRADRLRHGGHPAAGAGDDQLLPRPARAGAGIPVGAEDPGLGPQLVESGTLTLRGFTADVVVHRADGGQEVVPAGAEASLGLVTPSSGTLRRREIRNDGTSR